MSIELRIYQQEALDAILASLKNKVYSQIVTLPTGAGKTILFSALVKTIGKRTLIVAHRRELLTQARDKILSYWPGADVGIYSSAAKSELNREIVICSIQSASRIHKKLKKQGFSLLVIDEAHHAAANSYQLLIKALDAGTDRCALIGVTATPQRKALGRTFQKITYACSLKQLIKQGYLTKPIGRRILTDFDLKGVRSRAGDFVTTELSEAMNIPQRNLFIVEQFQKYALNRKAIAFCCDVQHSKDLSVAFNASGIPAAAVYGSMNIEERARVLGELRDSHLKVVTSCQVLTEGFDLPSLDCILLCRPTKSTILFQQMVGRGLRSFEGKDNCLILDFTDRHNKLSSSISLSQAIPEAKIIKEQKPKPVITRDPHISTVELISIDEEIDLLSEESSFIWMQPHAHYWSCRDDTGNEMLISKLGEGYIATVYFFVHDEQLPLVSAPASFQHCIQVCEEFAQQHLKMSYQERSSLSHKKKLPASDKQKALISSFGYKKTPENMMDADLMIRTHISRSRFEQRTHRSQK